MTAASSPISLVLVDAAEQAGVSVLVPPGAESETITLDLRGVPAEQVFEAIGERLELVPTLTDGLVAYHKNDGSAREFVSYRVGHLDAQEAAAALQSVVGLEAKVTVLDDRLVVAGSPRSVDRAAEFSGQFTAAPDAWRLEVRIVSISKSFRRDLGLDWSVGGSATLSLGAAAGDLTAPVLSGTSASVVVQVIAEAVETGRDATLLHSATLYVLEGGESTMTQGDRVPIPKFQTSPEGTTTIVGYEFLDTGFELTAAARRVPGGVRLQLDPSISSVVAYVGDAPVTTQSRLTVDTIVTDESWLVVSGLTTSSAAGEQSSVPWLSAITTTHDSSVVSDSAILFLVKAIRHRSP